MLLLSPHESEVLMKSKFKLPLSKLKRKSRNWNKETWEKYLSSFETNLSETIVSPKIYSDLIENLTESIFQNEICTASDDLFDLQTAFGTLTSLEKKALSLLFWEGKSEREAGQVMKIDRRHLRSLKQRAFRKIKNILLPTSHLIEGENSFPSKNREVQNGSKPLEMAQDKTSITTKRRSRNRTLEENRI